MSPRRAHPWPVKLSPDETRRRRVPAAKRLVEQIERDAIAYHKGLMQNLRALKWTLTIEEDE